MKRNRRAQEKTDRINSSNNGPLSFAHCEPGCDLCYSQNPNFPGVAETYSDASPEVTSLNTRYHTATTTIAVDRFTLLVHA